MKPEPHEFSITRGLGAHFFAAGAKTYIACDRWVWICKTHRFGCDKHMTLFMEVHREMALAKR